jgi:DNA polymerase III alpha subunit
VVADLAEHARVRGIPIGPGRGTSPGSLVAWALGITGIDPIECKLVFERFLNVERANSWSMSIDVCARRRVELLDILGPRRLTAYDHSRGGLGGAELPLEALERTVEPLPALTFVQDVVERVNARPGQVVDLDVIEPHDAAVFSMIARGDTSGVFWFDEDEGIVALARRLRPSCLDDLMLVFALYRPGPMAHGIVDVLLDRKDRDARDAIHPAVAPILADTYGVIVYQEQVIQIAHRVAGYSYTRGDLLRRTLGTRRADEVRDAEHRFVASAMSNNIDVDDARAIFKHLDDMSGFAFIRAHAAAYGWLAYQAAYLKHYFPMEFGAALDVRRIRNPEERQ